MWEVSQTGDDLIFANGEETKTSSIYHCSFRDEDVMMLFAKSGSNECVFFIKQRYVFTRF